MMEPDERPLKVRKLTDAQQHETEEAADRRLIQPSDGPDVGASGQGETNATDASSDEDDGGVELSVNVADAAPKADGGHGESVPRPMSKNQMKKLRKRQEWEAGRDYRKAKRKEKTAEKRARKRTAREEEEAKLGDLSGTPRVPRPRRPVRLPVSFIIDCGFDDLMSEKERISLGSQLTRAYSDNSRAPFQAHLFVSSWGGRLKDRFDTVLNKHYENWKCIEFVSGDFVDASEAAKTTMASKGGGRFAGAFAKHEAQELGQAENVAGIPADMEIGSSSVDGLTQEQEVSQVAKLVDGAERPPSRTDATAGPVVGGYPSGEIVYLTSDSPNTLEELKPFSTYIVGGLVDKNRHKGVCYRTARDKGVKTAKLPIGEFMEMQSRFVLATNHVVEIMLRWLECGNWGEAFLSVIPKRKGGSLRSIPKLRDTQTPDNGAPDNEASDYSCDEAELPL